jgi:hypothetical protein
MTERRIGTAPVGHEEKGMRKKAAAKRPRREQVTSCTITPAAWNRLRSFVFQLQNGQPLAFADCLALEARVHQFVGEDQFLIALVAEAWRQTYPAAPTEIALPL